MGARAALDLLNAEHYGELSCYEMRLLISELVTNSVRHGGARGAAESIELTIVLTGTGLRVECADPVGGLRPAAAAGGSDGTHRTRPAPGRGALERLGTRHGHEGSTWFEYRHYGQLAG